MYETSDTLSLFQISKYLQTGTRKTGESYPGTVTSSFSSGRAYFIPSFRTGRWQLCAHGTLTRMMMLFAVISHGPFATPPTEPRKKATSPSLESFCLITTIRYNGVLDSKVPCAEGLQNWQSAHPVWIAIRKTARKCWCIVALVAARDPNSLCRSFFRGFFGRWNTLRVFCFPLPFGEDWAALYRPLRDRRPFSAEEPEAVVYCVSPQHDR